jgi:hypothetical protein
MHAKVKITALQQLLSLPGIEDDSLGHVILASTTWGDQFQ